MPKGRVPRAIAGAIALILLVVGGLFAGGVIRFEHEHEGEGEESLSAFVREHPEAAKRKLPIAVIREKLDKGKEGTREITSGPAQQQVDQRAYPRKYVETKRAVAARRAFRAVPSKLPASSFRRSAAPSARASLAAGWAELGPKTPSVPAQVTYTGAPTTNSGRVTSMAIAPDCGQAGHGCRMWIGAAGGGVFRTDDATAAKPVWVSSSVGLTSNAIGSLLVDPNNPSTLYAGTGEPNGSSDSEAGVGLFKSTNGGDTWSLVPGSFPISRDRSIASVAVDPTNPAHIYIGTALARHGSSSSNGGRRTPPGAPKLGLYESTDGGTTFSLAFSKPADPTPPETGNDFFTGGVNKVLVDPNAANRVYVAVLGYGVWRRTGNGPFEQAFATKFPADSADPTVAPDTFGDRTEFDLADLGTATRMYVGDSSDDNGYSGLWRTDDAANAGVTGGSATTNPANDPADYTSLSDPDIAKTNGFTSYFYCHTQCGYDDFVRADPNRPNVVYLGGSMNYDEIFGAQTVTPGRTNGRTVVRSDDSGVSFTDMTNENKPTVLDDPGSQPVARAEGMHPDQHALVFNPAKPDQVFVGSDGGVVRTSGSFADDSARCDDRNAANGFSAAELALCKKALSKVPTGIDSLNDGLRTLQFQSLSLNSADPNGDVIGGTQDNGTWAFSGSPTWFESIGGDGGQSAIDPAAGSRVHTYFGPTTDVNFHGDDPDTWDYISQPLDDANSGCGTGDPRGECFSFYVPMIADPKTPGTLFTGGEYVWRTKDSGGPKADLDAHCRETAFTVGDGNVVCGDWERLGGADGHIGTSANYIVAAERSPANTGTLWVGRRRGGVFVSHNADAANRNAVTFQKVSTPSIPDRFVSSIHPDPADANHAWVSFSGYEAYTPGQPGHVFDVRVNPASGSATWTDLTAGLGDQPITDLVRDDATGDLYAATDFGVLRRPAGATDWEEAAGGMPPVAVYGLTVSNGGRVLYAATHGRGAWRVQLPAAPAAPAAPGAGTGAGPGAGGGGGDNGSGGTSQGTPVPAKLKPRVGRLSGKRSTRRLVAVTVGVARTSRLKLTIRDQKGRLIGTRTVKVKRDDLLKLQVKVRPRGTVTSSTRWRVGATATGTTGSAAKSARFRARR